MCLILWIGLILWVWWVALVWLCDCVGLLGLMFGILSWMFVNCAYFRVGLRGWLLFGWWVFRFGEFRACRLVICGLCWCVGVFMGLV